MPGEDDFCDQAIDLAESAYPGQNDAESTGIMTSEPTSSFASPKATTVGPALEAAMSDDPTRNMIYRFWQLTISQRRLITQQLGLVDNADMILPEAERYGRAFVRAKERGLLGALAAAIQEAENT